MKKIKLRTWIAFGCVALAIVASQVYDAIKNTESNEEVAVISEIIPTSPSPISKPVTDVNSSEISSLSEQLIEPEQEKEIVKVSSDKAHKQEITFNLPASGEISNPFSDTELTRFESIGEWRCHLGIDFLPSENDLVFAAANGVVSKIYEDHLYGKTIIIDHGNEIKTLYASLGESLVSEGVTVTQGTEIGRMGETAPIESGKHLHFALEKEGVFIDPFGEK